MRTRFDEQLALLTRELTEMGALCEESIAVAAKVFSDKDKSLCKKTIALNQEVHQRERDVESLCLRLLLQQQPVARDLRQVSAALKMVTDLERISQQAADIGGIISAPSASVLPRYEPIREMAKSVIHMVTESIDAYVKQDIQLAEATIQFDDVVDDAFQTVKSDLIEAISNNPTNGECALDLLMIAKYLEGIGDHAVNIAQWVRFSISGTLEDDSLQAQS